MGCKMLNENLQLRLKKVFDARIVAFYEYGGILISINRHLAEAQGQDGGIYLESILNRI